MGCVSAKPKQVVEAAAPQATDAPAPIAVAKPLAAAEDSASGVSTVDAAAAMDEVTSGGGLADAFAADAEVAATASDVAYVALLQIAKGFLLGFLHEAMPDVPALVKNVSTAFSHFRNAVEAFRKGDVASITKALDELAVALETLKKAVGETVMAKEQLEKLEAVIVMLQDPNNVVYHVGQELLVNGKDILSLLQTAADHFKAQEWESFGESVGAIVGEILTGGLADEFAADAEAAATGADAAFVALFQIAKGFLRGFLHEAVPDVPALVKNVSTAFSHFRNAVEAFRKGDDASISQALEELAIALETLKEAVGEAVMAKEQLEKLEAVIVMLKDPNYVVYHVGQELLVNGSDILSLLRTAADHFDAQEWESFGESVGAIVGEILTSEPPPDRGSWSLFNSCCKPREQPEVGEERFLPEDCARAEQ